MFFKSVIVILVYIRYVDSLMNRFNGLHKLPLLSNYMTIKRGLNRYKNEPSNDKTKLYTTELYNQKEKENFILEYLLDNKNHRDQIFDIHTGLINESQNIQQLNNLLSHFINELLPAYTLFFFEIVPALYLYRELKQNLGNFMNTFEQKLSEHFKISTMSIIDASPKSKTNILLNTFKFRLMVEKLSHLCKIFNIDYKFEDIESVLESINDERLSKLVLWNVVHSEAFKKGVEMLSKALVITALNNFLLPFLLNYISKIIPVGIPGYDVLQYILKSLKLSVN